MTGASGRHIRGECITCGAPTSKQTTLQCGDCYASRGPRPKATAAVPAKPKPQREDIDEVVVERLVKGQPVTATPAERAEAIRQLARRGLTASQIGDRIGCNYRTAARILAENCVGKAS